MKYIVIFTISYLGLLWERTWNRLWAPVSLILFFIALALLNIPLLFGTLAHILLLGVFALALIAVFLRTEGGFALPAQEDVERRMEKAGSLEHRPLETLRDKPAEGLAEEALGLWRKHLQKAALYINRLKVYTPQTDVSRRDRYALRHAALLFLVVGMVVAQNDGAPRLRQALFPDVGSLATVKTAVFDLWITPPEYTREAAIFLAAAGQGVVARDKEIRVPQDSIMKLRLSGYRSAPELRYGGRRYALTETAPGNFTLELPLQESGKLRLTSLFRRLGQWSIAVAPDTAPEISIVQIDATPRSATKITYAARDDHGIVKISGLLTPATDDPDKKTWYFDIPPTGETSHIEDLTAHPRAGLPVAIALEAEDTAGNKSTSAASAFVLPERIFTNPVAQLIVEERKKLSRAKDAPGRRAVAENLGAIAGQPLLYKGDKVIFLSLSLARNRLIYGDSGAAVESVQALLWDVALKLEDGGLSLAQRELRDSLQKMANALNDKSLSQDRLQDIIDGVQKKMQQYVQALALEMQQRLQQGKKIPVLSPDLAQKFMKNIDLGKMLEQMRRLSQTNSREYLQKMAENLKNTIDGLDLKKIDQMQEKQIQAMEALRDLEEIIHRQQALLDKTNKSEDPEDTQEQALEQSALRYQLGRSLGKLGNVLDNIPDHLAQASQAMKLSAEALDKGAPQASLPHQKTVLDELQKGLDSTIEQMAQDMQQSILSFGMQPSGGDYGENHDPLGRNLNADDIEIPDEKEQRRVQEIIEELRRRSNDPDRDKVERDYLDRLLERF